MLLFAYGTLLDPDIRSIVLGRSSPEAEARPALLPGYRRVLVADECYPTLLPDPAAETPGALVPLRHETERQRVQYFEGFELLLDWRTVRCRADGPVQALVCIGTPTIRHVDVPWDLDAWRARHKDAYLPVSHDYMAGFGRHGIAEAHRLWIAGGRGRADGGSPR